MTAWGAKQVALQAESHARVQAGVDTVLSLYLLSEAQPLGRSWALREGAQRLYNYSGSASTRGEFRAGLASAAAYLAGKSGAGDAMTAAVAGWLLMLEHLDDLELKAVAEILVAVPDHRIGGFPDPREGYR